MIVLQTDPLSVKTQHKKPIKCKLWKCFNLSLKITLIVNRAAQVLNEEMQ